MERGGRASPRVSPFLIARKETSKLFLVPAFPLLVGLALVTLACFILSHEPPTESHEKQYFLVRFVLRPFPHLELAIGKSAAQRQNASDLALLKHSSPSLWEPDPCALTQRTSRDHGDRQTKRQRQTYGRTDVRQDTQTDGR